METTKVQYLLVSLVFLLTAYGVYSQEHIVLGLYGIAIDNTGEKLIIVIPSLFVGLIFLYMFFKTKYKKIKDRYVICPKCEEAYDPSDLEDDMCPKCDIKTENLEGFYKKNNKNNLGN